MTELCVEVLLDLRDQAVEEAAEARDELVEQLGHDEDYLPDFTEAMASVAHQQPYARWWTKVTDQIDDGDLDPIAALTNVRAAAENVLLRHAAAPRVPGPWVEGLSPDIEAARRFYNATAPLTLQTNHGTGSETDPGSAGTDAPSSTSTPTPPWPTGDPDVTALLTSGSTPAVRHLMSRYHELTEALLHPTGTDDGAGPTTHAAPTTRAVAAARELAVAMRPLIVHLPTITAALTDAAAYRAGDGGRCIECPQTPGEQLCDDHANDEAIAAAYDTARHAIAR